MRHINKAGLKLVKEFEGCKLTAYYCPAGVPTIGYGHTADVTGEDVAFNETISQAAAEELLLEDLHDAERAVTELVEVPLSDNQFAALVSFTYNLGRRNLHGSTLRILLNEGEYDEVPAQLKLWINANGGPLKGLQRRRLAEAKLWDQPPGAVTRNLEVRLRASISLGDYGDEVLSAPIAAAIAELVDEPFFRSGAYSQEGSRRTYALATPEGRHVDVKIDIDFTNEYEEY